MSFETTRRGARAFSSLLGLLAALACGSPIKVNHHSAPELDWQRYRTYGWLEATSQHEMRSAAKSKYVSALEDAFIRRAVEKRLDARGYRKVDPSEADLLVTYAIGSEQKIQLRQPVGQDKVYYVGTNGLPYRTELREMHEYTQGSLAVEFFDRETAQAVWVGHASKHLTSADDDEAVLDEAIAYILQPVPAVVGAP